MDIYLDRRAARQVRLAAEEAIEEGDTEALREDVLEAFSEEQVEEIERRLDSADFFEFVTDVLDEWGGDDVDELFELLETQLAEVGIDFKADLKDPEDEEEEEADEEDVPEAEDLEEELTDVLDDQE
jgi:lantibiotic modifying enzyme